MTADKSLALQVRSVSWLWPTLQISSVAAFVLCLYLPAFEVLTTDPESTLGWNALWFGWSVVPLVGRGDSLFFCFAWLANPAFIAAHVNLLTRHAALASAFAFIGLVLAASFSLVERTGMQGQCLTHPIKLQLGYAFWVLAMMLVFVSAMLALRNLERGGVLERHRTAAAWLMGAACTYVAVGVFLPLGRSCVF